MRGVAGWRPFSLPLAVCCAIALSARRCSRMHCSGPCCRAIFSAMPRCVRVRHVDAGGHVPEEMERVLATLADSSFTETADLSRVAVTCLVSRVRSLQTESLDTLKNFVCTLRPSEWLGGFVVARGVSEQGGSQFHHAAVDASPELSLGPQREPRLNLRQPGTRGGREVKMIARMVRSPCDPAPALASLVDAEHQGALRRATPRGQLGYFCIGEHERLELWATRHEQISGERCPSASRKHSCC